MRLIPLVFCLSVVGCATVPAPDEELSPSDNDQGRHCSPDSRLLTPHQQLLRFFIENQLCLDAIGEHCGQRPEAVARYLEYLRKSVAASKASARAEPAAYDFEYVVLNDVQGLFGGCRIFVRHDGLCIVEVVTPHSEGAAPNVAESQFIYHRVRHSLPELFMCRLRDTLVAARFFSTIFATRYGRPDEGRPSIRVRLNGGLGRTVSMFDMDTHSAFCAVFQALSEIGRNQDKFPSTDTGEFSWAQVPPEFSEFRDILTGE